MDKLNPIRKMELPTIQEIVTTAFLKEIQSPEFQNDYTQERKADTIRVFSLITDMIEKTQIE